MGNILSLSRQELLAENSRRDLKKRLRQKGLRPALAERAAAAAMDADAFAEGVRAEMSAAENFRVERFIGENDLVDIRFLLNGARTSAAVARIRFKRGGFGTGFLIAPGVMMTNWHVFETQGSARRAVAEFGYRELDEDSRTTSEATVHEFDPDRLFYSHEELDFAVVAVGKKVSGDLNLDQLPTLRLPSKPVGVIAGERLNVIQHPGGEPKQVALRDNVVVSGSKKPFLWYRADTHRGSSGSPVLTDEWELVALHHSGVPEEHPDGGWMAIGGGQWRSSMGDDRVHWIANEAVDAYAIVEHLEGLSLSGEAKRLVKSALEASAGAGRGRDRDSHEQNGHGDDGHGDDRFGDDSHGGGPDGDNSGGGLRAGGGDNVVTLTVPLEIFVRIGAAGGRSSRRITESRGLTAERSRKWPIDTDYSNREGYRANFLRESLPLPKLTRAQKKDAAINRQPHDGDPAYLLRYTHFSVVMHGRRRLAYFTAVNIDGENMQRVARKDEGGSHGWIFDRRIKKSQQVGNDFYRPAPHDRGHLVRRLDPAWGTKTAAKNGIVDTFHWTNCAPQMPRFNQGSDHHALKLWRGLEDFVLDNADASDVRVSVLTGPVFRRDDPTQHGVRVPLKFWKIVAWVDDGGDLRAAAFLLSQRTLIPESRREAAFDFTERRLFQTTVAKVASDTDLDFGPLDRRVVESFGRTRDKRIRSTDDIRLS